MIDIPALVGKLIEDPDGLPAYELGMLSRSIACATEAPTMPPDDMDVVVVACAALGADGGSRDIQAEAAKTFLVSKVQDWADEIVVGPGRGYSDWERAPDRTFTPVELL